jgi:nitrilase
MGDGSAFDVVETRFGRLGGLTSWENYMPLARMALYEQGIDVYVAPTWDNSEVWAATLRHIAKEGRVYVIGASFWASPSDVPSTVPFRDELYADDEGALSGGVSMIVGPDRRHPRRSSGGRGGAAVRRPRRAGRPGVASPVRPRGSLRPS